MNLVDDKGNSYGEKGLQNNFGIGILYGAGLEIDIYKGIMLKSEWRNELFKSFMLIGIGYNFSK